MSKTCPKCGSIRIVEAPSSDVSICLACESFLNTVNDVSKPTVFDQITQSPEVLAEDLVYSVGKAWASTLIVDTTFDSLEEAIDATLEELNKVSK